MKGVTRFRKIWIWIFFIGFALLLLSSNFGRTRTWNPAEQILIEITAPIQNIILKSISFTENVWLNYFFLVNLRIENQQLKKEINSLRIENAHNRELLAAHERLQGLLEFKQSADRPVLAAQVIGLDPTGWFKSVIIDKGTSVGLKTDMPVVSATGVVGRIVSASRNYAKVLLIIDQNSAVDCLIQRSRERGMVKGISLENCKLDYMVKSSDVEAGDMVVTSGLGGVFPKGIPVGQVLSVNDISGDLFREIRVKPTVDFSKLEEVLVILKEGRILKH